MDPVTIGMILGAIKGGVDSADNKRKQKQLDVFRTASIQYSPWTDLGDPGYQDAGPTGLSAVLGGAAQGAAVAGLGKKAGLWGETAKTNTPEAIDLNKSTAQTTTPMSSVVRSSVPSQLDPQVQGMLDYTPKTGAPMSLSPTDAMSAPTALDISQASALANPVPGQPPPDFTPKTGSAGAMGMKKVVPADPPAIDRLGTWELLFNKSKILQDGSNSVLRGGN